MKIVKRPKGWIKVKRVRVVRNKGRLMVEYEKAPAKRRNPAKRKRKATPKRKTKKRATKRKATRRRKTTTRRKR